MPIFTQYDTVKRLMRGAPTWVEGDDRYRVGAYSAYEQIYWNVPEAFKVVQRGGDETPIYIPSGRQIVDTLHRYMAPGLNIIEDPEFGTDVEKGNAKSALTSLLRRERFYSEFSANKRYGIIRGDWGFHLYADPTKPEGSRISIFHLDPGGYFPITNPENIREIIGCHLVEEREQEGKPAVFRLTYRKTSGRGGPSPITWESGYFKPDSWGGPGQEKEEQLLAVQAPTALPAPIDQLPVYHIQHFMEPGSMWGSSEMRGIERMIAAINQGISDEELSLALDGLGVYATTAGEPVDEKGQPVGWDLGPGRVVEIPEGASFNRVSGTTSVTPYQDHLKYIHDQIDASVAQPQIAKGQAEVSVAESGIARAIQFMPMVAHAEEKEQIITAKMTNLLYDLRSWFLAYEGLNMGAAVWIPTYGDKIPPNRKERFDEIMAMLATPVPIVSTQWARDEITKLGYTFPDHTLLTTQIVEEKMVIGAVEVDPFGTRQEEEVAPTGEEEIIE